MVSVANHGLSCRTFNLAGRARVPSNNRAARDSLVSKLYVSADISVGTTDTTFDDIVVYGKGEPVMLLSIPAAEALATMLSAFVKADKNKWERRTYASI